ncbi:uncharacterized protein A1O5_13432 [Cladophialophora psammophila CBS 110553]|uniref:Calponin-homology (CH) domain-containing protein n=1 Tax=Cladophialophora psammophila CBS 110553 TaxID=1182543 RepID=W9VD17_9EURO|nr:uncharacterized protein A1O5_13432 [Cladophialophora psammophila CBS 110553]EXJ53338.1 hypothetical protein A1O5_13432 [Cladophialophora psammophila CBS 110553]
MLPPSSTTAGTPCPFPLQAGVQLQPQRQQQCCQYQRQRPLGRDSILSSPSNDTTANIEFTSAFAAPAPGVLRNAKPRRRRRPDGLGFMIHEDKTEILAAQNGDGPGNSNVRGNGNGTQNKQMKEAVRRKAVMSQPPQRPRKRAATGSASITQAPSTAAILATASADEAGGIVQPPVLKRGSASTSLSQAPRRPITTKPGATSTAELLPPPPENTIALPMMDSTTTLKPARRATIYIPTEDTTMPSIYMGIFSPIKGLDPVVKSVPGVESPLTAAERSGKPDVELTGIIAQMVAKKRGGGVAKSVMSPKRIPLQVTTKPLQESAVMVDRWGQGGGKENVPPGEDEVLNKKTRPRKELLGLGGRSTKDLEPVRPLAHQRVNPRARVSLLHEPTPALPRNVNDNIKNNAQSTRTKPSWNAGPRLKSSQPGPAPMIETLQPTSRLGAGQGESLFRKPSIPSRFVIPKVDPPLVSELYPIITEDFVDPAMYEDNWLSHQEIVIAQLVNNLFGASTPISSPVEDETLRLQLLETYGDPGNVMLYKRLQGALSYGALSVPMDVLKGAVRLSTDLGKRKTFTDLWLGTYDLPCLRLALEVVVGRQCSSYARESSSVRPSIDNGHAANRRTLQQFIETFLIRNEDGQPDEASTDRPSWSYQRTLLRSLMLIKLLDTMAAAPSQMSRCLFRPSSSYKTSVSVVKALFQLLNPSAGDPIRALNHIGYVVTHIQHPLAEYSYKMENLAVDLRDGVRLTRLVELLLYPSASQSLEHVHDSSSTTSVLLPTGEELSLTGGHSGWPLSQHLKYPCPGRATKLYNVQIALSAIQGVKGVGTLAQTVKAEDIVDGFREKTVRLLWGLTSKWGLAGLVDWNDVEREIKRLCRTGASSHENDYFDMLPDEEGHARHTVLLKAWAQAIASRGGIRVKNLTTDFTDGRVFAAIVEEYEQYLSYDVGLRTSWPLAERLRRLGCSEQFAMLFAKSDGPWHYAHIFDRDFVVAALAFLCSRLLNPTKGMRAAVTIQRRWRSYWARAVDSRKLQLRAVAESCARVAVERATGARKGEKVQEEEDIWLSL